MKIKLAALFSAILLLALPLSARADGGEEAPVYLYELDLAQVSLCDEADVEEALGASEEIYAPRGIYRTDDPSVIEALAAKGMLACCTLDQPVYLQGFAEDAAYYRESGDWRQEMLGCRYVSKQGLTGKGVRVGVIDSGLMDGYAEHTGATIEAGENFVAEKGSPSRKDTSDGYGHGTFVSSIITDKKYGIAGGVTLIPLRCFDNSGRSEISYVVAAIYAAVEDYDCDVINLSLGARDDNPLMKEAIETAVNAGVVVVAAAGNITSGSTGNDSVLYPAAYPGVISVGSVFSTKTVSNRSRQNRSVDIVAPGAEVIGLDSKTGKYKVDSGTSFAAPVVTAAVALMKECKPKLTTEEITGLLESTAQDLGASGYDYSYGYGLVNIGLLLATVREDESSVILSKCGSEYAISSYLPTGRDGAVTMLALYNEKGRMLSARSLEKSLCNAPLPDGFYQLKLFTFHADTMIPYCEDRRYR